MKTRGLVTVMAVTLGAASPVAALPLTPGVWEMTARTLGHALPKKLSPAAERKLIMALPPVTTRDCLSVDAIMTSAVPMLRPAKECKYVDLETSHGKLSGGMSCRAASGARSESRINGDWTAETLRLTLAQAADGRNPGSLIAINARRIGPCPK